MDALRTLAKTDYYQSLYNNAKELHLQFFENNSNFTRIQLIFLSLAGMYSVIQTDIVLGEVSEKVLDNFIYEDAYMHYKQKTAGKDTKQVNTLKRASQKTQGKEEYVPKSAWSFKRKK